MRLDVLQLLLDGLLALARVEAGTAPLADEDVSAAVRGRCAAWEPVFTAAQLRLTADVQHGLRTRALPDAVGRVLDALLDNAAEFVPPGSRVDVHAGRREGELLVLVGDDGPGFPPEQLPLLLRRFGRAPLHQNTPGSGLGLAIADEIAHGSGGSLTVRAAAPHGLRFELRLPAAQPNTER
ncbi:sensor histidine kinase [Actinacidiphila glaucinigra]|uniref:sensor histidine kinase n=1 Tax=Actinacidiphila glaucinigra TaxID=235986 RepID=UPI0037A598A3